MFLIVVWQAFYTLLKYVILDPFNSEDLNKIIMFCSIKHLRRAERSVSADLEFSLTAAVMQAPE